MILLIVYFEKLNTANQQSIKIVFDGQRKLKDKF